MATQSNAIRLRERRSPISIIATCHFQHPIWLLSTHPTPRPLEGEGTRNCRFIHASNTPLHILLLPLNGVPLRELPELPELPELHEPRGVTD